MSVYKGFIKDLYVWFLIDFFVLWFISMKSHYIGRYEKLASSSIIHTYNTHLKIILQYVHQTVSINCLTGDGTREQTVRIIGAIFRLHRSSVFVNTSTMTAFILFAIARLSVTVVLNWKLTHLISKRSMIIANFVWLFLEPRSTDVIISKARFVRLGL